MRPLDDFFRVLSDDELDKLHAAALDLLRDPGMKIENETALKALARRGADVDGERVKFPTALVEETLSIARKEEQKRFETGAATVDAAHALTFSWHTPFRERTSDILVSMGGGCPRYYDHERGEARLATADDFLRMVHLAEGIPEIVTVGNAVHYLKESDGSQVPGKTFPKAASSISGPAKRLAQVHTEYLAAEFSFPDFNFIWNDSDYTPAGNGPSIFSDISRYAADDIYFQTPGVLPVPVSGGWIFRHLFHGVHDGGPVHRS